MLGVRDDKPLLVFFDANGAACWAAP
jgi:hypothetical protein